VFGAAGEVVELARILRIIEEEPRSPEVADIRVPPRADAAVLLPAVRARPLAEGLRSEDEGGPFGVRIRAAYDP